MLLDMKAVGSKFYYLYSYSFFAIGPNL